MTRRTIEVHPDGPGTVESPSRPALRKGELIARTVAFVGGASLLVGGLLGYALGFIDGSNDKREGDHDV